MCVSVGVIVSAWHSRQSLWVHHASADVLLCLCCASTCLQAVAVEEDGVEIVAASTAPEDLRYEVFAKRAVAAPARSNNLMATAGLNLPSRNLVS